MNEKDYNALRAALFAALGTTPEEHGFEPLDPADPEQVAAITETIMAASGEQREDDAARRAVGEGR